MRNCRKYCKHSPEIGDLILSNGLSYNVLEYKKLINPRAIINVRGSIKEEDALPGDYILDIGIYVPADVYEIIKDVLPGEEIVDPMNIITYKASAKLSETTSNYSSGLHTNAFSGTSGTLTMTSHTFESGVGTIEFDGDITIIGQGAFNGCSSITSITIPDSVTSIGNSAFSNCSSLTSVTIPDSVTSIGNNAFMSCTGLTSITISESVTSIGGNTFYNCTGLTNVTIGSGVTSIGQDAFNYCTGLTNITISDSVTNIGGNAFYNCSSLTNITIPDSVISIGINAFGGCYFTSANFVNNSSLDEVSNNYWGAIIVDEDINGLLIKNNGVVKYRGTSNSVTIPNTVTSIDVSAFSSCSGLISITIPNSVTGIGNNVFRDCSNLTSVTIGSGVTSIGGGAFRNCTSLTSITSNATTAPTIQSYTFQAVKTGGTLTVPSGSTGYDVWMGTRNYYLGKYNWTKVEQ